MSGDKQHSVVAGPTLPHDLRKSEKINLDNYSVSQIFTCAHTLQE